jgi:hypothetical protein
MGRVRIQNPHHRLLILSAASGFGCNVNAQNAYELTGIWNGDAPPNGETSPNTSRIECGLGFMWF